MAALGAAPVGGGLSSSQVAALTPSQRAMYEGMSEEERAAFSSMSAEQRAQLESMSPEERSKAMSAAAIANSTPGLPAAELAKLSPEDREAYDGMSAAQRAAFASMSEEQRAAFSKMSDADRHACTPTHAYQRSRSCTRRGHTLCRPRTRRILYMHMPLAWAGLR